MTVLAIDPGNEESAWVVYDGTRPVVFGKQSNEDVVNFVAIGWTKETGRFGAVAIEMIASYGMPVGREVFDTCRWIGRFEERAPTDVTLVYRQEVKLHLCGQSRAKDANVRQALVDRFGGAKAKGTRKQPGPLYGISGDCWSALGVAVTWWETKRKDVP